MRLSATGTLQEDKRARVGTQVFLSADVLPGQPISWHCVSVTMVIPIIIICNFASILLFMRTCHCLWDSVCVQACLVYFVMLNTLLRFFTMHFSCLLTVFDVFMLFLQL